MKERRALICALLCALLLSPASVMAQDDEDSEEDGEEDSGADDGEGPFSDPAGPIVIQAGLGPAIALRRADTQLKIAAELIYHLGDDNQGLGIGGHFHVSLLAAAAMMQFQAQGRYAIPLAEGISMAPLAAIGIAVYAPEFGDSDVFFNVGVGVEGRLSFGTPFVFLRPLYLDFFIGDEFQLRYDILVGGGVTL